MFLSFQASELKDSCSNGGLTNMWEVSYLRTLSMSLKGAPFEAFCVDVF